MKQFNLEEYLANPERKVVTRDGRSVRIICTDKKGEYTIVALAKDKDDEEQEDVLTCCENGKFWIGDTVFDLFFAPVKQSRWVFLYRTLADEICASCAYTSKEAAEYGMKKRKNAFGLTEITWEE